jgi:hypothetical protein
MKNQVFGTYEMTCGNFNEARNYFYNSGRIDIMRMLKYKERFFDYGIRNICIAILSDSVDMLKQYAGLSYPGMDELVEQGELPIWVNTIGKIILDDKEGLARNLEIMVTNGSVEKAGPALVHDFNFFKGMYENDLTAVQAVIEQLVTPGLHEARNEPSPGQPFLSLPAIGYAKLARMKGLEVKVNSHLLPEGMVDIQPLREYTDRYEFVEEYLSKQI